jgi:hypothetical protein
MKINILLLSIVSIFSLSCTKDLENERNESIDKRPFVTFNNGVKLQKFDENLYIYQGDMLISAEQANSLVSVDDTSVKLRGTIRNDHTWSNGVIPYVFESGVSDALKQTVLNAMQEWESKTPVRFVQRTNQSQHVKIDTLAASDNAAGYSTVGNVNNAKIRLKLNAATSTCLHELGHTIGLVHEHERDDRSDHIVIHQDEIEEDYIYALNPHYSMTSLHPFDFGSIMLYGSYSFIKGSNPTITTVDGNTYSKASTLSIYDAEIVKYYYNNMTYNSILKVKGNIRNSADYTIVYPQSVKLGDNIVITVKAK